MPEIGENTELVTAILEDTGTTLDTKLVTIDTVVDAIKAKTDNLPASPAATPTFAAINYSPSIKDSTDLEAATKTITATAEASGVGNADYSWAPTAYGVPSDSSLSIICIAALLNLTIDSMTAATLSCRIYVDAQDANHRLYDGSWTTTGAKADGQNCLVGDNEVILNLLKDGSAHIFYFFFWVDAGEAKLSVVRLYWGAGAAGEGAAYAARRALRLTFSGLVALALRARHIGGTSARVAIVPYNTGIDEFGGFGTNAGGEYSTTKTDSLVWLNNDIQFAPAVAGSAVFLYQGYWNLRSP